MDVRLPAPAGNPPRLPWLALVIGAVLIVTSLAATGTQALDRVDVIDALMLALTGLVIAGWGGYRLWSRPLLQLEPASTSTASA
ncbi:hypothetical protein GCM10022237_48440 [Nocardioides ginsengisoli]|uniref:Uncharacterized protein n=1 Tax=Nocardioides ginsengisoli TaxID=363868 RepID=A0ABW3W3N8_9ACTN